MELITYVFALGAPIISRLPGIFFHPASTSITAYGVATKRPLAFYMIAVALHFSNNFLALTSPFMFSTSLFIAGIAVLASRQLYGKTKEKIVI